MLIHSDMKNGLAMERKGEIRRKVPHHAREALSDFEDAKVCRSIIGQFLPR